MGGVTAPVVRQREIGAVLGCLVLGWFVLQDVRVPVLAYVDLGFHELGHYVCYPLPVGELFTAAAGSIAQIAVPLGLAVYFLLFRWDNTGAAICTAWAATSAMDVSRYMADAPFERLELLGGDHDWAFFFSAEGIDAMDRAESVAGNVANLGWLLLLTAFVIAVWPALKRESAVSRTRPL
jgi:hypothetical protein